MSTLIASRIWTTAGLVAYASVLIVIFGIGLGILSGLRRGLVDTGILLLTAVSAAIPAFVAAIVLILVFAVNLGWFPALGNGTGLAGNLRHLTLPAVALAISSLAIVARVTRAAVRDEAGREHVQTAVSRGIPARLLIRRHVLRNAAIPITTITGITIASLIALDAVVETAFSLNGLGAYLVQSAQSKDLAVVQGISLVLVTAFVVVNLDRRPAVRGARPAGHAREAGPSERGHGRGRADSRTPACARQRRGILGRLRATGPAGLASAGVIVIATFAAVFGPLLAPYSPVLTNLTLAWVGPVGGHLLGFDGQGRDVLSRLLAGATHLDARPAGRGASSP